MHPCRCRSRSPFPVLFCREARERALRCRGDPCCGRIRLVVAARRALSCDGLSDGGNRAHSAHRRLQRLGADRSEVAVLLEQVERDPAAFRSAELSRMTRVMQSFQVYKAIEISIIAAGAALAMFLRKPSSLLAIGCPPRAAPRPTPRPLRVALSARRPKARRIVVV